MSTALLNHLLQSTVVAVVAAMLTLLLSHNRARTRYWIWLAASMKFLIPFSLFVEIGRHVNWSTAPVVLQPRVAFVIDQISQPFAASDPYVAAPVNAASAPSIVPVLMLAIWICGIAAVLIFWFVRWRRVAAILRASVPIREGREFQALRRMDPGIKLLSSPAQTEPGVFGILRPALCLPAGIPDHLDDAQLDAIFAHELCHVRCLDNLTAALHMLVEAVFWFHPLVWWLGAKLVEERELACDEEVVRLGSDPEVYAESILKICRLYLESPLVCVSGITGSDLTTRIEAIMKNAVVPRLSAARKAVLLATGGMVVALPLAIGIVNLPDVEAQVKTPVPKFEVASIRPGCAAAGAAFGAKIDMGSLPRYAPPPPKPVAGGNVPGTSPGRLNECHTLADFVHMAYVMYAGGTFHGVWGEQFKAGPPLEGGPAWIRSDSYQILAKAQGTESRGTMSGPMLQALLEDRFKLKLHRDTREVPIYALTVTKGGSKLQPTHASCVAIQPRQPGDPMQVLPAGQAFCKTMIGMPKGGNMGLEGQAATLDELSVLLSHILDRPVVNQTGVAGKFDLSLQFAAEGTTKGDPAQPSGDPAGPSIFTAIQQQLGLKLEATKGPGEFLVVDHVERPSAN